VYVQEMLGALKIYHQFITFLQAIHLFLWVIKKLSHKQCIVV